MDHDDDGDDDGAVVLDQEGPDRNSLQAWISPVLEPTRYWPRWTWSRCEPARVPLDGEQKHDAEEGSAQARPMAMIAYLE